MTRSSQTSGRYLPVMRSTPDRAPPVVLYVGRLEPLKAPELFVEAAARLGSELEVVFVGRSAAARDGKPYREWLESFARQLDAPVRFEAEVPRDDLVCGQVGFGHVADAIARAIGASRATGR